MIFFVLSGTKVYVTSKYLKYSLFLSVFSNKKDERGVLRGSKIFFLPNILTQNCTQ